MAEQAQQSGATPLPVLDLATAPVTGGTLPRGRYVALVPGEAAPLIALDLPPGLRGAAREQVAQRQLGDLLGDGAAGVQMRPFALGGAAEGWTRVMVTAPADLARWRGLAGRRCVALLPDYLALPVAEGLWTVAAEEGRVRARFGPAEGVTTTETGLCLQAARLLEAGPRPDRVLRYGAPLPAFEAQMEAAGVPVTTDARKTAPGPAFARGELALDLRADPQAARQRLVRQIRAWRWPVLTGALAAGLWAAAQLTVIRATEEAAAALNAGTLQVVRESFVPSGPILDARVQVARALDEARAQLRAKGGEVSPLDLLADAAPVIAGAGAELRLVSWQPDTGLRLELRLADFAAVDALVDALSAGGLRVSVRDARLAEATGRVTADLNLARPEGGG